MIEPLEQGREVTTVDHTNINSQPDRAPEADSVFATPVRATSGGIGRTASRIAVGIVVGVGSLAIVVGLGVSILSYALGGSTAQAQENPSAVVTAPAPSGDTSTQVEQAAATTAKPAAEVPNSAVFTFRDIFEPLIKAAPTPSTPTTPTTTPTAPTSQGTLFLQNIVTEGGVLKAVLLLDGKTYTLAAGGSISGTPWLVLSVNQTSVTMLYGDIQVVLTIGQGITK